MDEDLDPDVVMRWCPCGATGCTPSLMKEVGGWLECNHCHLEVDHADVELSGRRSARSPDPEASSR